MNFDNFVSMMEEASEGDIYLYFITRTLKSGIKKTARMLDKYAFNIYQSDINDEIRSHLSSLLLSNLRRASKKDLEVTEYDILVEDAEYTFTYSMQNKAMAFQEITEKEFKKMNSIQVIKNLGSILVNEELWASCIGVCTKDRKWLYAFRKLTEGKIAVDVERNPETTKYNKIIRTVFNTKNSRLELLHGETINLDKSIDCIFYDSIFYILHKGQFEKIIGLEEEYKEEAKSIVQSLKDTKMITGLELIESEIEKGTAIHRQLVRLSKVGNYENLNKSESVINFV